MGFDKRNHESVRLQQLKRGWQDQSQRNKADVRDGDPYALPEISLAEVAAVEPFLHDDARILTDFPVQLAVSDIDGVHLRRPVLQKAIGESSGGCADVEGDPPGRVDIKCGERAFKFQSTATDEFFSAMHGDLCVPADPLAGFIRPLTVDKNHAGHEGTLGALAGREVAAFDKQCVEAQFFRIVQCDESVQVLGFHARRCYCMSDAELKDRIKTMMVESLMLRMKPEDIGDDVPLFAPDGLALDSIDALELAVGLEKTFGVATPSAEVARTAFLDVNSIAAFVQKSTPPSA